MKKKSPRGIPDFSRKTPAKDRHDVAPAVQVQSGKAPSPRPMVKPQSSPAKSGPRGK